MRKYQNVLSKKSGSSKKSNSKKEEEKKKEKEKEKKKDKDKDKDKYKEVNNNKDSKIDEKDIKNLNDTLNKSGGGNNGDDDDSLTKKKKKKKKVKFIGFVENDVKRYIIGQDYPVRQIITAVYKALTFKKIKSNILIIGKSGTGKTETVKQIARVLNIPCTIEDATKYTSEGYYGADVVDMIYNLLDNADNDYEKASKGILAIDEIDKKLGHEDTSNDVAGVEVLKSLLKIIEGTTVKVELPNDEFKWDYDKWDFDTSGLIVVMMGCFPGLDKIRDKRLNVNKLGFDVSEKLSENSRENRILKKELIDYGMPEEFVGRIDTIIEMNQLTVDDLEKILKYSKLSILEKYKTELKKLGIKVKYSDNLCRLIAEEALQIDTGARELKNVVNDVFADILYKVFSNPKAFRKCVLSDEIVKDNTKYELS